jgi:hypothetical protein
MDFTILGDTVNLGARPCFPRLPAGKLRALHGSRQRSWSRFRSKGNRNRSRSMRLWERSRRLNNADTPGPKSDGPVLWEMLSSP